MYRNQCSPPVFENVDINRLNNYVSKHLVIFVWNYGEGGSKDFEELSPKRLFKENSNMSV